MQPLGEREFNNLRQGAKVLEEDRYGVKVMRLADGTFLKLFRRKSWFSKTLLCPPAKRFANNTAALKQRHIPCPTVISLYKMGKPYRSVVHYEPLAGDTLRDLLSRKTDLDPSELLTRLASFVTTLHDKGVYFRSLHLGNIVLTPDNEFGLIDISDMRCFRRPLSRRMRARNYQHLLRYEQDWRAVDMTVKRLFSCASQ